MYRVKGTKEENTKDEENKLDAEKEEVQDGMENKTNGEK